MDAGTTSAYRNRNRNRKRPLNGRPCKAKRRLFPADVAAETESSLLRERQRHVVARSTDLLDATAETMHLLVEMGWYSGRELDPLFRSLMALVCDAIRACRADGAPVEVPPALWYFCHFSRSYEGSTTTTTTSSSSPAALVVESGGRGGAALVPVTGSGRSKRQAKANSKYCGPEWTKK